MASILSAAQQPGPEASRLLRNDGTRPRILLAEDSTAARILIAHLLRRMGCEVDAVEHGEEALVHIRNRPYDAIILDIEMPVMDGVTTARHIRDLGGAAAATPIVAFSAFLADTQPHLVRNLFDGVLAKPAGRRELQSFLKGVLAASSTRHAATPAPAVSSDPAGGGSMAALEADLPAHAWHDSLSTAMNEFRQDLGAAFRAFARGELEQLRYHCHIIKGVARTFAAAELAEIAGQIENQIIAQQPSDLAGQLNRLRACAELALGSQR